MEVIGPGSTQRIMISRKDDHGKCSNIYDTWEDLTDISFEVMIMTS